MFDPDDYLRARDDDHPNVLFCTSCGWIFDNDRERAVEHAQRFHFSYKVNLL